MISKQLELFSQLPCVVVDHEMEHLASSLLPLIAENPNMQRFGVIAPATVFKELDATSAKDAQYQRWVLNGIDAKVTPKRLQTFQQNMCCVKCKREANVFLIERHVNETSSQYLNLYHFDGTTLEMFTVDHILLDSLGGRYHPTNFQTMCAKCNSAKGCTMTREDIERVLANPNDHAKSWLDKEYLGVLMRLHLKMLDDPSTSAELSKLITQQRKGVTFNASTRKMIQVKKTLMEALGEDHSHLILTPTRRELQMAREAEKKRKKPFFVTFKQRLRKWANRSLNKIGQWFLNSALSFR